jgi:lipoprotein-releasing system permease protein
LLSVFNGFEGLVKSLYSSFYADIRVASPAGSLLRINDSTFGEIRSMPKIKGCSGVIEEKALVQNGDFQTIAFLKGVEDDYKNVSGVSEKIVRGKFFLGTGEKPFLVLGGGLENSLALDVERSIYPMVIYLFRKGLSLSPQEVQNFFASDNIYGAGTFFIQQDIDTKYALTNISFVRRMMGYAPGEFTSVEISLHSPADLEEVSNWLRKRFPAGTLVESRFEQNRSLYRIMQMEKWAVYLILTLMLGVAAFTMIGSLTMLVMEKQKDIQVLKAMGATQMRIQGIFLSEGMLLGMAGGFTGSLLGAAICLGQRYFKWVGIQGGTFLIDYYPVDMRVADFLLVAGTVCIVSMAASWWPSRNAAHQPIELKVG